MNNSNSVPSPRPKWPAALRIAGVLGCALLFAGCPAKTPTSTGKVVIRGSNTVGEELGPRLIAEYRKINPAISVDLESKATGYGLAALMAGQCDIAAASRTLIKDEEELAQDRHFEFNDYTIGSYCVAVIVNAGNPVSNLTTQQVHDIFVGKIRNWSAVGGPDAAIHLCIRDPISGTYLGFRELAMNNDSYEPGSKTFTNYAGIVEAVAGDREAIGYSGLDLDTRPGVKPVSIDGLAPSELAVQARRYPYQRVLRFYTNKNEEAPDAMAFIQFVQSAQGQAIVKEMGFVGKP